MSSVELYLSKILAKVECNENDRADLLEEMKTHLEEAKLEYMKNGDPEKVAEEKAIADFGEEEQIGSDLQHSMFPYRTEMLLFVGIGTMLFSLSSYFHNVMMFNDNTYLVLTLSVVIAAILVFAAVNPSYFSNRKIVMNSILASLTPFYFINFLIIDTSEHWYVPVLEIFGILLVICTLLLIFLTALKTPTDKKLSKRRVKQRKVIHVINILIGIVVVGFSMLFSFGVLIFAGPTKELLFPLFAVFLWALLYWLQIKYIDGKRGEHESKEV